MRRPRWLGRLVLLVLALALAGCGRGVKVATPLVEDVARSIGVGAKKVIISDEQIGILAGKVEVEDDVIRAAAKSAQQESVWQRSLSNVVALDEQTKGTIRSIMVATACDVLDGEIVTYQDLFDALVEHGIELAQSAQQQLANETQQLIDNLDKALSGEDEASKAAVAVLCFTANSVGG
jgi:hypothetical protein